MRLAIAFACGLAAFAAAAAVPPLVPPPGFRVPAAAPQEQDKPGECPRMPPPYTGELKFPSRYEGSGSARDRVNPRAQRIYKAKTADITEMEKGVSGLVRQYLHSGRPESLHCALDWLDAWAAAGALEDETEDHTGRAMRKWALGSLAAAYLRLEFSASRPLDAAPEQARRIEAWFARLAQTVVDDWGGQPLRKVNNHEYWAAWAAMAAAVALDRRDLFDWSVRQYRVAARQIDEDGYLPNELARETRALWYHNYALNPLVMIAAFAQANGVDLRGDGDDALARLAVRVLRGVDDPKVFERRTGKKQVLDELRESSKFAWLEPYCWLYSCDAALARRVERLRPMSAYRLGGDVTELFKPPAGAAAGTGGVGRACSHSFDRCDGDPECPRLGTRSAVC